MKAHIWGLIEFPEGCIGPEGKGGNLSGAPLERDELSALHD